MPELFIDFESYSTVDSPKCGADVYARHPDTGVHCMAWTKDDDSVQVWTPANFPTAAREAMRIFLDSGATIVAHNVHFEMLIWNHVMVPRYGWPPLSIEQCECTMAMAYAMALPGSLGNAAAAVGIDMQKDMKGHRVMMQLARPKDDGATFWTPDEAPEKFEQLYAYCRQDVETERALYRRLMMLSGTERKVWLADWTINQRGVAVDLPAVGRAIEVVNREKKRLDKEMRHVTGNAVATCSAVSQLCDWLRYRGVETDGLAKADVLDTLDIDGLPADCHEALLLRQEAARSSTAKLEAMEKGAGADGRMRGLFQYHGAGTGRWAGRRVQLQNLPRPGLKPKAIDEVLGWMGRDADLDVLCSSIDIFHGPPMSVMSDCIRGFLIAAPGNKLIDCDFSAIEARVLNWLCGQEDIIGMFREYDAGVKSKDPYIANAMRMYGLAFEAVESFPHRQAGKFQELGCGFGMGKDKAVVTAKTIYGLDINVRTAETWVKDYRARHPRVTDYWTACEDAAMTAVMNPGGKWSAGARGREVSYKVSGSFLWCRLPSGRVLCYPYPRIEPVETPWGQMKDAVTYMTTDGLSRKWERAKTYGGKLVENVTQAVARDLLSEAILRLEAAGYPVVLHAHDEAVAEVSDTDDCSLAGMAQIMSELPSWAAGLPVAADGWESRRYRK